MTTLPSDLDVARQLTSVRAAVLEATHHVRSPKRSTRFRVTRNLIIAGAAIAALTAGAIVALQEKAEFIDSVANCYHTASLEQEPVQVIGDHGATLDPFSLCGVIWREDMWDESSNLEDPNDGTLPVPPLVACTGRDGIVAVFPRGDSTASDKDFCEALGLADWSSD